jgi:hypothetical protein
MDVLTIVCCTPDKPERRAHMLALCRSEGLEPQFTTDMGLFVHRDDPECAALGGAFPPTPAYQAHYLTYMRALVHFIDSGREYLLLLEDDVARAVPTRHTQTVHEMIASAPEFDLLFLEYCSGQCGSRPFGELGPFAGLEGQGRYVTGLRALCTGACVYTRTGAMVFVGFADRSPAIVIDQLTMVYASTVRGTRLVVYVNPPAFVQDRTTFSDGVTGGGDMGPCRPTYEAYVAIAVCAIFFVVAFVLRSWRSWRSWRPWRSLRSRALKGAV